MEQITLYYRQDSSDKVYQARIEPKDGGFVVNFAYGRRGATLQTGTKNQTPVTLAEAKRIYDRLVGEKAAKGYTPGEDGTPYQHTDKAQASTGIHCQLLNAVDEGVVDFLLNDPAWWLQEKFDGRRLLIRKEGDAITGINRLGLVVGLPQSLLADMSNCAADVLLDGEAIDDTLRVFDVLQMRDRNLRGMRYGERYLQLSSLLESFRHSHLVIVETAFLPKNKIEMFRRLEAGNREGVVFKRADAPFTAGRPTSCGPQLKYKFVATASFVVGKINARRSVGLLLFDGDKIKPAGKVTIPPNHEIPTTGQVVECRYLYAFRESGCINQPVYLGTREDIRAEECVSAQLKYKAEAAEEAA